MPSTPSGGSLAQLMENSSKVVDMWVDHCTKTNASTPELIAMMGFATCNDTPGDRITYLTLAFATAVQRLRPMEENTDGDV